MTTWGDSVGIVVIASPNEPRGRVIVALVRGIALVILYGSVAAGFMGYPR